MGDTEVSVYAFVSQKKKLSSQLASETGWKMVVLWFQFHRWLVEHRLSLGANIDQVSRFHLDVNDDVHVLVHNHVHLLVT